jgi:hypothetical protein
LVAAAVHRPLAPAQAAITAERSKDNKMPAILGCGSRADR